MTRLTDRLDHHTPELGRHVSDWMGSLAEGAATSYFTHPEAFPMLQLPMWLERTVAHDNDPELDSRIAYSTICGYYFVRMLDNLMDGEVVPSPALPAMILLHTEFQATYQEVFPAGHAFWPDFMRFSYASAEMASMDSALRTVDAEAFQRVSSRKIAGSKIPIAAVCHRYGRTDRLDAWSDVVDLLGRWHQMRNDVLDWARDRQRGGSTYFLTTADLRAASGESTVEWIGREGLTWARGELSTWMNELRELARGLGSSGLQSYLEERERRSADAWERIAADLAAINELALSLDSPRRY